MMSFKARGALIRSASSDSCAFAAVVLNQQESHFNLSFNAEHVSRLCPSGALSQGMHLVSGDW